MTLSDLSIRKPVFAWILMIALILFGAMCFRTLGISQLPDVPTITEATGLPNFDVVSMFGILAPAGTPKPIIDKLSEDIKVILQRPEVQERMLAAGVYVNYLSPADSAKRIHRELAMWAKVVKDANIKAD